MHPASTSLGVFFRLGFLGFWRFIFVLLSLFSSLNGFMFRFTSTPAQCDSTSVIWTDGRPPYKILLLPIGFLPQGIETRIIFERIIRTGNQATFTFPFPQGSRFVAVMSDEDGFGTGGTSAILTVDSSNSSSCIPSTPSAPEFYLYLSSVSLSQCESVDISWGPARNPPVTIYGVIPQGQSFDLDAASHANGGSSFDWTVNIRAGTPFFFVAGDRNGSGKGGSTDVQNIGSGPSRCISSDSPSSTPDTGVGAVGSLLTPSETGTATITQPSGGDDSNGNGSGSSTGTGDGNGSGGQVDTDTGTNGDANENENENGNDSVDDGSGGGTVHGPEIPTTTAKDSQQASSKTWIIVAIIMALVGLGILIALATFLYKQRQRRIQGAENQRARLLLANDISEVNMPRSYASSPHRPEALPRIRPEGSLETLGGGLRATPFIWPLVNSNGVNIAENGMNESEICDSRYSRDIEHARRENTTVGTMTARPKLQDHSTSSGILQRWKSSRFGVSVFGFPSRGGSSASGYRSLREGEDVWTTNSQPRHMGITSGSATSTLLGTEHHTSDPNRAGSSNLPRHKSVLPPGHQPHSGHPIHDSGRSPFFSPSPITSPHPQATSRDASVVPGTGAWGDGDAASSPRSEPQQEMVTRPSHEAVESSPPPVPNRPSWTRIHTGDSIWEVPPTYASLQKL